MPVESRQWTTSLDGISNLTLTNATIPDPINDQILVRITAVSLNYKDGETIEGLFKHHKSSVAPPNLVPCSDSAGVVVAVGPKVTKWKVSDRVLSTSYPNYLTGQVQAHHLTTGTGSSVHGVLCDYRLFDQHAIVRTPSYLTDIEACNLQIAGTTAWMALCGFHPINSTSDRSSETVLLQGTGGVSIMGLLLANHLNMTTIITSSSDAKLARAKDLGATHTINYTTHPAWDEEVLRLTNGAGADIIFENGGALTIPLSYKCIAWGGLINSIGYVSGKYDPPGERMNINVEALKRNFTLKGLLNGPRDRFEEMLGFCERHEIRPVVDRVFGFEEAREAVKYMWEGRHFGKVVIRVAEEEQAGR